MCMMAATWEDKLVVAAIDFGTAFTGCAISYKADYQTSKEKIITLNWMSGNAQSTQKTPTVLLLKPDGGFEAFGYEAENRFSELADDEDVNENEWHFFKHFKMTLHNESFQNSRPMHSKSTITDQRNRDYSALEVFAISIRYVKDKIIERVKDQETVTEKDVYFVLTCPAIWSEHAKQFMRNAAFKAGIPHDHLRIGLEPECAAIYLHNVTLPELSTSNRKSFGMQDGDGYLIVDMGGGTVDIAAHKINRRGAFEEIMVPNGGPWGALNINLKFEQALVALSGGGTFETFRRECSQDYLELMRSFEYKKIAFPGESSSSKVVLTIPTTYRECHLAENHVDLTQSLKEVHHAVMDSVQFNPKNNKISLTKSGFENLYKDTLESIVSNVKTILSELVDKKRFQIKTIFCVGGFADCQMLRDRFKTEFEGRVVFPKEAITAVMKGAIIFGRDERIVETRISKFTYGLDWSLEFDPKKHLKWKLERTDSGPVCRDCFLPIAQKDQSIRSDMPTKVIDSYVKTVDQKEMEFPFYRTSSGEPPKYIDEPGCLYMGSMCVALDDISGGLDRSVKLEIYFGATEMRAVATDNKNRVHSVAFNLSETQV
ncbi:heat shock 70 kDa protein 12B-like isoform X2 [Dreissena polymorpha]|uniref:heat shock 70 kDa protein 12B-like isoform X2 n=1 Tax=Dreissena polymorpha TaxID=45954 RepID=UPI0022651A99|nr:heat shock 70 kDa protein 12B-like isoform X2 [Dreissena polymorpha]